MNPVLMKSDLVAFDNTCYQSYYQFPAPFTWYTNEVMTTVNNAYQEHVVTVAPPNNPLTYGIAFGNAGARSNFYCQSYLMQEPVNYLTYT